MEEGVEVMYPVCMGKGDVSTAYNPVNQLDYLSRGNAIHFYVSYNFFPHIVFHQRFNLTRLVSSSEGDEQRSSFLIVRILYR